MYRPKEITDALGIGATTLRRWSTDFADSLSPTAGQSIAESGGPAQRRYTDADVALLISIQRDLADSRSVEEVKARLARGDLAPAPDVVVNNLMRGTTAQSALTEPPTGEDAVPVGALVARPGYSGHEVAAALAAISAAFPTLTEALQQVERSTEALAAATARQEAATRAQQYLVEELRQEREALATLRAEAAAERAAPKVLPVDTGLGARLRRWFTGSD